MPNAQLCADDLTAYLAAHNPFRDLDAQTLAELGQSLELVCLPAGAVLMSQGDPGDCLYMLLAGRMSIVITGQEGEAEVDRIGPGVTVGEMALLGGQTRSATVIALDNVELLRVARPAFQRLAVTHPDVISRFATGIAPRIHRSQLAGVLTHLFGPMDAPTLHEIESEWTWRTLVRGEVLFREGGTADALYLVIHGRIGLSMANGSGSGQVVAELTRGDIVGDAAILTGEPHQDTARAMRDSIVAGISREAFERVTARYPRAMSQILKVAFGRERKRTAGLRRDGIRPDTVFALLPVSPEVPLAACGLALVAALAEHGSVLHLTSKAFDDRYCNPGLSQIEPDHPVDALLVARLSEAEREHRYVIYEADLEPTAWSQRCVRQADRVLLVGLGGQPPPAPANMSDIVVAKCGEGVRCELLLVQPGAVILPHGTAAWLDRFPTVIEHHHVRLGHERDWRRAVRRLTGHTTGLVFSGGGARGMAHVGVWRALEEAGIEIDMFGGTSMGAIVGALCAMGWGYEELARRAGDLVTLRLADPTLPLVSFLATKKIYSTLLALYGDTQIEDLWWPFFAMATNLSRGVPVVMRRGPLARAVRASMAVPGIFPPVCIDGEVHVDGGVLDNVPIDVMHGLVRGGKIIAINAWPEADMVGDFCFGESVSGWSALAERLNPLDEHQGAPLMFEVLFRLLSLGGAGELPAWRKAAALYICPPVDRYSPLAFTSWRPLVEIGYQAAKEAIAASEAPAPGDRNLREDGKPAPAFSIGTGMAARPARSGPPYVWQLNTVLAELEHLLEGSSEGKSEEAGNNRGQ